MATAQGEKTRIIPIMVELIAALTLFTGIHVLPSTPLRAWLIARLGRSVFMWLFSAVSIALFAWVWLAYRAAPIETVFWVSGPDIRKISAMIMLFVLWLASAAVMGKPRVLLTGEQGLNAPDAIRGVLRITRHPMLWAVGLWAVIHMANNADPASWVFFGYIAALSFAGTWLIDRRRKRLLGAGWELLRETTSNIPFLAILTRRNRLALREIGWGPVLVSFAVSVLVIVVHELLFGVPIFN